MSCIKVLKMSLSFETFLVYLSQARQSKNNCVFLVVIKQLLVAIHKIEIFFAIASKPIKLNSLNR